MKRAGFTMIELIFVIVILGILAAVAIPKLAATRNDAKIASEVTSMAQALQNLGAEYTAQGAFTNYTAADANSAIHCADFNATNDGNVTLTMKTTAPTDGTCPTPVLTGVTTKAKANGLVNASGTKTYQFGGTGVKN
jgi:general secretion pathway protein G